MEKALAHVDQLRIARSDLECKLAIIDRDLEKGLIEIERVSRSVFLK